MHLTWNIFDISVSSAFSISAPAPAIIQLHWWRGVVEGPLHWPSCLLAPVPKYRLHVLKHVDYCINTGLQSRVKDCKICRVMSVFCSLYVNFTLILSDPDGWNIRNGSLYVFSQQHSSQCYYVTVSIVVVEASAFLLLYRICFRQSCSRFWSTKKIWLPSPLLYLSKTNEKSARK